MVGHQGDVTWGETPPHVATLQPQPVAASRCVFFQTPKKESKKYSKMRLWLWLWLWLLLLLLICRLKTTLKLTWKFTNHPSPSIPCRWSRRPGALPGGTARPGQSSFHASPPRRSWRLWWSRHAPDPIPMVQQCSVLLGKSFFGGRFGKDYLIYYLLIFSTIFVIIFTIHPLLLNGSPQCSWINHNQPVEKGHHK